MNEMDFRKAHEDEIRELTKQCFCSFEHARIGGVNSGQ